MITFDLIVKQLNMQDSIDMIHASVSISSRLLRRDFGYFLWPVKESNTKRTRNPRYLPPTCFKLRRTKAYLAGQERSWQFMCKSVFQQPARRGARWDLPQIPSTRSTAHNLEATTTTALIEKTSLLIPSRPSSKTI